MKPFLGQVNRRWHKELAGAWLLSCCFRMTAKYRIIKKIFNLCSTCFCLCYTNHYLATESLLSNLALFGTMFCEFGMSPIFLPFPSTATSTHSPQPVLEDVLTGSLSAPSDLLRSSHTACPIPSSASTLAKGENPINPTNKHFYSCRGNTLECINDTRQARQGWGRSSFSPQCWNIPGENRASRAIISDINGTLAV